MCNSETCSSTREVLIESRWVLEFAFLFFIVTFCFLVSDQKRRKPESMSWLASDRSAYLGAEFDSIARAIVAGRGFSDPFQEPSGPTAWMPPVQPVLLASAYLVLSDSRARVAEFMLGFQAFVVFCTGWLFLRETARIGRAFIGYIVFPVFLFACFHDVFQSAHDVGIILLFVGLIWWTFSDARFGKASASSGMKCGLIGGLAALCSPVLGAVWAANLVVAFGRSRIALVPQTRGISRTFFAFAIAMSLIAVTPWTVRNLLVFRTLIPIKSNAGYELWLSQCLDDDGVLDEQTFKKHVGHPNSLHRIRYREAGEINFVADLQAEALAAIMREPRKFVERVLSRASAALLCYQPERGSAEDKLTTSITRLVFPLPFIGFLVVLISGQNREKAGFVAASLIYLAGSLPYILVSYYSRYSTPFLLAKMLLVGYGVDAIFATSGIFRQEKSRQSSVVNGRLI